MAKQTVSFGERHVEKFVAGVAGAIFLAVLFLYVFQSPYTIDMGGEAVSPGEYYVNVDEQADTLANRLRTAPTPETEPWTPPRLQVNRPQVEVAAISVPVNPSLPQIEADIQVGNLQLATILPPKKPTVTTGRGYAALPETQTVEIGDRESSSGSSSVGDDLPQDMNWASVFAVVDREAQHELFLEAKYAQERQKLIVVGVEAERQRLLPNGTWESDGQVIRGYAPERFEGRAEVNLVSQQNGEFGIRPADYEYLEAFRNRVATAAIQERILRPDFQSLLPNEFQLSWKIPETVSGQKIEWENFQVSRSAEKEVASDQRRALSGRQEVVELRQKSEAALKEGRYIEAEELLRSIVAHQSATPIEAENAQETLRQIEYQVTMERRRQEQAASASFEEEGYLGPKKDLLWLNDLDVQPGEVYRYRVRLLAFNQHAGYLRLLANPEDAAKVILPGEWSEWSDQVEIEKDKYFFILAAKPDENSVRVELRDWTRGSWVPRGTEELKVGQPIAFTQRYHNYVYDGVIAAIDTTGDYLERVEDRSGNVNYSGPTQTAVLALITESGDVVQRFEAEDRKERRVVERMIEEQEKKDEQEPERRYQPPQRDRQPTPRGPGRFGPPGGGGRFGPPGR